MTEPIAPDILMKPADVAKIFDVQPATVRIWLNEGKLKGVKIGKGHYWRIPSREVNRFANELYGDKNARS